MAPIGCLPHILLRTFSHLHILLHHRLHNHLRRQYNHLYIHLLDDEHGEGRLVPREALGGGVLDRPGKGEELGEFE